MGMIQDQWNSEMSRVEEGIFFGNDEYIALQGLPGEGYTVDERRSVAEIIASKPEAWCDLCVMNEACDESSDWCVYAGETSWEAEGFVAVVDHSTGQLLWLLHLSTSESFTNVTIHGDVIHAKSGGYPDSFDWRIPILAPEVLTVVRG